MFELWNYARTIFLNLLVLSGFTEHDHGYYRAAVVEHIVVRDPSLSIAERALKNLELYKAATKTASENGADIIVFPEWGLNMHEKEERSHLVGFAEDIPDPKETTSNPCVSADAFSKRPILKALSCMAKENSLFLVANMIDHKNCIKCDDSCDVAAVPSCNKQCDTDCRDGNYYHNTNVVFDRNGNLVARYYKRHLYFEFDMNDPKLLEDIYFETDFGNFTTFICFDMIFKESMQSVEKSKIVNVAYPTYWFDHTPFFFFATSIQQSFAMLNKVNLLAANVHYPRTGTLGSGIYSSSRGALIYSHNPDGKSRLLISNVPKSPNSAPETFDADAKEFVLQDTDTHVLANSFHSVHSAPTKHDTEEKDWFSKEQCQMAVLGMPGTNIDDYRCATNNHTNFNFVPLVDREGTIESCSNNLCCSLSYSTDSLNDNYFLGAMGHPIVLYGTYAYGTEMCFLARCDADNENSCTNYALKSATVFHHANLKGNFTTKYVYPYAINSDVHLANRKNWEFNDRSEISYKNSDETSLVFLGLYGRLYEHDIKFR